MLQLYDVLFASSNKNKYNEAKNILSRFGIKLGFFKCNLQEIQDASIKQIASHKVSQAYKKTKKPVIVEDDALYINALNGFPGPYSSYVFKTIGNSGIIKLVQNKRKAKFQSIIAFCDKQHGILLFEGIVLGRISNKIKGKGWGYDPIFIPKGKKQTYAMITDKNSISHRYKALVKFSNWFANK